MISLAEHSPHLVAEWDYERNFPLTPSDVSYGSTRECHWKCDVADDHRWPASPNSRSQQGGRCPFCTGHRTAPSTSIAATHPEVAKWWDHEQNTLTPYQVSAGSVRMAHWFCDVAPDHKYKARVGDRIKGGCSCCRGLVVVPSNCLRTTHPELCAEWDFEKNTLTPDDVTAGSGEKVRWRCRKKGHSWEAVISSRTGSNKTGCRFCSGTEACPDNCLRATHPELLDEWDFEKNTLTPDNVTAGSGKKVRWRCLKCGHSWPAVISNRTGPNKTGCPVCDESKGEEAVAKILTDRNVVFERQFKMPLCRNVMPLPFDFRVMVGPDRPGLIEFQGLHHYTAVKRFGGEAGYQQTRINDGIKYEFCRDNDMPLLAICFVDINNLAPIIDEFLTDIPVWKLPSQRS